MRDRCFSRAHDCFGRKERLRLTRQDAEDAAHDSDANCCLPTGPPQIWWTLIPGKLISPEGECRRMIMVTMRQYTLEFRQSAVDLVLVEGLTALKAAESLGIPAHTIRNWIASARDGMGGLTSPAATDPTARLRELEAENRMLNIERDILKKVAVGSTGQRNTSSNPSSGRLVSQGLARSLIELSSDLVEVRLRVARLRPKCVASTSEAVACTDLPAFTRNFARDRSMSM